MFAYVDETGNTGARLLEDDQPLFITAALMTRSDFDTRFGAQVRELAQRFDDDELHASKLGVGRLEEIASDLLSILRRAGPSFFASIVEKRYVLGTKAFHTLLDPAENRAVPTQVFLMRPVRMTMAFKFAWLLDEEIAQLFWDALMEVNANRHARNSSSSAAASASASNDCPMRDRGRSLARGSPGRWRTLRQ